MNELLRTSLVVQACCLGAALQIRRKEWTATQPHTLHLIWFVSQLYVTFLNAFKSLENLKFLSCLFFFP